MENKITFPKYQTLNSHDNQYYWLLWSVNGRVILKSSETYVNKLNCLVGIESSKRNTTDNNFQKDVAKNGQYYFRQISSGNFKELGNSEMYTTSSERDAGIIAVKRDAPIANHEDKSI
ncbi:MAG: YegP family protein [Saprospiraceae bacterium]